MKPNDMDIDEILRRYLPRASQEEADEAGERVLKRIRAMRFSEAAKERKPGWHPKFDLAVLAAVDELQGEGTAVTITLKVEELLEERIVSGSAVFLILLLQERAGLVAASPDPNEPDAADLRSFKITGSGREALAAARAAEARRAGPLADFA